MSKEQLYNERVDQILTTVNHKEPQRVPIISMYETWAISNANSTVKEIEDNPEKEIDIYCKPHEEIYCDCVYTNGLVFDAKSAQITGSKSHFISEDGQTVQHLEVSPMEAEDYPKLIKNPMEFVFNEIIPRKCANLSKSPDENYQTLKELLNHWKVKGDVQGRLVNELKDRHGLPVLVGPIAYPPMDIVFDYLRGFKGISLDLRRQQEQLLAGITALDEFAYDIAGITPGMEKVAPFPFYATMMHVPTFISMKQFEKFFLPTYEKMILKINQLGGKVIMFLEGNWESKYEWLNSLPKNMAIGILEDDDVFNAKKKVGDNITIAGGMSIGLLQRGSKEQCIDHAKKVIDECAPGGGYLFTYSRILSSKGDVNVENLKAVNEFVRDYAVYK